MVYLYIEHKITGLAKLTDIGGNGEFSTQKWKWLETGNFLPKTRIWMDMDLAERGGVEWVSKFCPLKGSSSHPITTIRHITNCETNVYYMKKTECPTHTKPDEIAPTHRIRGRLDTQRVPPAAGGDVTAKLTVS